LVKKLKQDKDFYDQCVYETRDLYLKEYTEKVFVSKMNKVFRKLL